MAPEDQPVALVTGGGGGIGAAIEARLAGRGYRLVVADVDGAQARHTAGRLGGTAVEVDVSDHGRNVAMVARAVAVYGRLDLVVLNAGVNSGQSAGDPLDVARYRRTNGVNVDGVVFGIDAALPVLSARGGAIVVISSLACLAPQHANPVYALGKSAVVGYVRALAAPLAKADVTINAVCPSFVDTPLLGTTRDWLLDQGFPMLSADDVAVAVLAALDGGRSGEAWQVVAGRAASPYGYPDIPVSLLPDGTPAPDLALG